MSTAAHSNRSPDCHWPKGKPRYPDSPKSKKVLANLADVLAKPIYGKVSLRQAALAAKVSERALAHWLEGDFMPNPEALDRLVKWVRMVRRLQKCKASSVVDYTS